MDIMSRRRITWLTAVLAIGVIVGLASRYPQWQCARRVVGPWRLSEATWGEHLLLRDDGSYRIVASELFDHVAEIDAGTYEADACRVTLVSHREWGGAVRTADLRFSGADRLSFIFPGGRETYARVTEPLAWLDERMASVAESEEAEP